MYYQEEDIDNLIGQTQDGFVFLRKVGQGGASRVYQAMEKAQDNRLVAVKVIDATEQRLVQSDGDLVNPFEREARFSRVLKDPSIVRFYKTGQLDDGRYYLAMEYVDGMTLAEELRHRQQIPWKEACEVMLRLGSATGSLHAEGFIHRDLKPGNVMVRLGRSGRIQVKLIDLGTARLRHERDDTPPGREPVIVGSPQYIAPEQAAGRGSSTITDVYALGAILYELLTGKPVLALKRPTADACLAYLRSDHPLPALQFDAYPDLVVPEPIRAHVLTTVSRDPGGRSPDGTAWAGMLEQALEAARAETPTAGGGSALAKVAGVFSSLFKRKKGAQTSGGSR